MTEFLEITTHPAALPMMIATHRIIRISPNADSGGAIIEYHMGHLATTKLIAVVSPTYADLRQLLQPINAAV